MRKKHAPTEVLIFFLKKRVTLLCYCGVNVKYEFLSKTLLMNAAIYRVGKCQSNDKLLQ